MESSSNQMRHLLPLAGLVASHLAHTPIANADTLFVSNWGGGTISEIAPNGTSTTFASGLTAPSGLAFNSNGNLFEADESSGKIYEFTPAGIRSTFASGLGQPYGLAFDAAGNLYVSNAAAGHREILKITPQGSVSIFATGFLFPEGLAFDTNGNLYVADFNRIDKVTTSGAVSTFASALTGAVGLAFAPNGMLFLTTGQAGITEYTHSGSESFFGSVTGEAAAIAIDASGNIFVSDRGNETPGMGSIDEFSPTGSKTLYATGLTDPQQGIAFETPVPSVFSQFLVLASFLAGSSIFKKTTVAAGKERLAHPALTD